MTTITCYKISHSKKLLGILTSGHLINDFYSVTLPFLLPTLILTFDLSFFEAGLLAIATSLFSGFLEPVVGYLADIYARRKMIIILGFFAFSLGLIIVGFSVSYLMLIIAFVVFGLGQATFHAQSTTLITKAFPSSRGQSMGLHGIGGSIGKFSAPILITFLITALSWRFAVTLLAIPGLLMMLIIKYMLSEPPQAQTLTKGTPIISGKLLLLALNISLLFMAYTGFLTFLPTFLVENGSSLGQAGLVTALMFFVGFLSQPVGGFIYDKFGGRLLLSISSLLTGAALLFFTFESNIPSIVFIVIIGAATQATFPVSLAMGSEIARPETVGASVGFVFGLSGVLASFTPALIGYTADSFGLQSSFRLLVVLAALSFSVSFLLPGKRLE